jgi:hypothetical protein
VAFFADVVAFLARPRGIVDTLFLDDDIYGDDIARRFGPPATGPRAALRRAPARPLT